MVVPARFTKADSAGVIRNVTANMLYAVIIILFRETGLEELTYQRCSILFFSSHALCSASSFGRERQRHMQGLQVILGESNVFGSCVPFIDAAVSSLSQQIPEAEQTNPRARACTSRRETGERIRQRARDRRSASF